MAQQTEREKLIEANEEYQRRKRQGVGGVAGKGAPAPDTFMQGDLADLVTASRKAKRLPSKSNVSPIGHLAPSLKGLKKAV